MQNIGKFKVLWCGGELWYTCVSEATVFLGGAGAELWMVPEYRDLCMAVGGELGCFVECRGREV